MSLERSQRLWKGLNREYILQCISQLLVTPLYGVIENKSVIICTFSGATASHAFVLESKTQGRFQASPAIIKYRVATKAALQV